jgi:hypothetical protein
MRDSFGGEEEKIAVGPRFHVGQPTACVPFVQSEKKKKTLEAERKTVPVRREGTGGILEREAGIR